MNTKTLQLKHLHYGFMKDGIEEVQTISDVSETTDSFLQAIIWDNRGKFPIIQAIAQVDIRELKQVGRATPMDRALQQLKNLARRDYGVSNVKVQVQYVYGGTFNRD